MGLSAIMSTQRKVSVVIITYNEENRIRACLESIFNIDKNILSNVILVDSNSTDNTIEVASNYPIDIIKIIDDNYTSPAAGRYIGAKYVQNDYVLFIDGDMELNPNWIKNALNIFEKSESIAGISGYLNKKYKEHNYPKVVKRIRGVMLFRRSSLIEVNNFNPFISGAEEYELCYRLLAANYRLLKIPSVVAEHEDEGVEPLRRLRRGYYLGSGQIIRHHFSSIWIPVSHIWHIRRHVAASIWLLGGLSFFIIAWPIALIWVLLSSVMLIGLIISGKNWKSIFIYPFVSTLKLGVAIKGLLKKPYTAKDYPDDVYEIIINDSNNIKK